MTTPLLPTPKRERPAPGVFPTDATIAIGVARPLDDRLRRAVHRFAHSLSADAQVGCGALGDAQIVLDVRDGNASSEQYRITVDARRVTVSADGPAGLFYGLQTLLQIDAVEHHRWRCRTIEDQPDLATRGFSLDVTRGKVPTLATLKTLIDRLASFKINHLQLYVEHTFDFQFDPDIARACSGLTHRDITEIDVYCRDRFIDLAPSLACFGHMGRVLSLPQYRHLAEVPSDTPWEDQSWPQRLRGLTIDPRNPQSQALLNRMLDEFLPLFSSPFANIGGDEAHDLGRGRNKGHCDRVGRGRLYLEHLKFLAAACARHGKRMMFWGDMVRSFPDLVAELPNDAVILDWGYEADAQFNFAAAPARGDRDVCVCPGTSGWNRVLNGMNNADANLAAAASAAHAGGANGLILTDWGDHGHFNMLGCSMPAVARAAALAWNAAAPDAQPLDRAIERFVFGADADGLLPALRRVARIGDLAHTWVALYEDIRRPEAALRISPDQADATEDAAQAALRSLSHQQGRVDTEDWRLACRASRLVAAKARLVRDGSTVDASTAREFADGVAELSDDYATHWHAHNKPNRLHEVTNKLRDLRQGALELAENAR